MEKLTISPQECEIFGNIISNKHGYLEDKNDFESHKCTLSLNNVKNDEWNSYNVYSFKLNKNNSLSNKFDEDIQYCKESSLASLFVCEHFDFDFNPYSEFFDVVPFKNGYTLKVKETYIADNVDLTSPFFLLIHQQNQGVNIPKGAKSIVFSSNYDARNTLESIIVGFVFFDENHNLIENQEIADIANEGMGNIGRCFIKSENIPSNAKYVSVEFAFPDGVSKGDYLSLQLNCLLFDYDYDGFIKN